MDAGDDELKVPYWLTATAEAANATFWRMLRRLPHLLAQAGRLAWQASPRNTAAVVGFELAAGVASAVGLVSVVGVLDGLLREGRHVRDALHPPGQRLPATRRGLIRDLWCGAPTDTPTNSLINRRSRG